MVSDGPIGEAHRRYTRHINFQKGWKGHFWQGRFSSFSKDEQYPIATARYIELNPVRAKMANNPENYKWSSAAAHLHKEDDILVKAAPLLDTVSDWRDILSSDLSEEEYELLRSHERTGRPLGNEAFLDRIEKLTSRILRRQKPGPKPKND